MKSTGIVRKVDELGRVVIPIELRRTLGIAEKDAFEIFVDGDKVILRKYLPGCALCENADVRVIGIGDKQKMICGTCADAITRAVSKDK
jgi:transcriptional pleiotropic regulator of transition state genes